MIDPVTSLDRSHGHCGAARICFRHWIRLALNHCLTMALIDFYQLAVLHKLSRYYGSVLSEPSHPPPMSAAEPPASLSSSVRFDQTTQVEPKTPQHNHHDIPSARYSTPIAAGTSVLSKLRVDGNQTTKYNSRKYEQYIIEDFERHRVFVDIDVIMKHVLRVPDNWEELWGPTIRRIKRTRSFSQAFWGYVRLCGTHGVREERFYKPLVDMTNAILNISESSDHTKPRTPQRYLRNDPMDVHCGVMKNLCPDVVAVHNERFNALQPDEKVDKQLHFSSLTWAQPLQVLEVKPSDNALVDGSCMPRLKVDGESINTSRGVLLKLTENRTRSARPPRARSHAVTAPEEEEGG